MVPIDSPSRASSLWLFSISVSMTKDFIGYKALTDAALRSVVRGALKYV